MASNHPEEMTAADYDANPLLDMACPDCSFLRSRHRELLGDVLIFPTILHAAPRDGVRYRDGRYRVIGCPHVRAVFGPHETQEAAQQAVREHFMAMRRDRERLYETPQDLPPETNLGGAAVAPAGMDRPGGGSVRDDAQRMGGATLLHRAADGQQRGTTAPGLSVGAPPESGEHVAAGEDAAAVAAPLRRSGGSIRANHEVNIAGFCRWCGWEYPKLNL